MGTPVFAVRSLEAVTGAGHEITAVYTRKPRPAGRGRRIRLSPVNEYAAKHGIPVRTPENFRTNLNETEEFLRTDCDGVLVAAYGLIIPQSMLSIPPGGFLNLHASLLPRWRGAAPVQRAIMAGDTITGVQVMRMEAGLDTGPVLMEERTQITPEDTAGSLHDRLAEMAARLAIQALEALEKDTLPEETEQGTKGVSYARKILPEERIIDWSRTATEIDCHIRGLAPFPGARFSVNGTDIKVPFSKHCTGKGKPGQIIHAGKVLRIACGKDAVELPFLQRAGRNTQDIPGFLRGFPLKTGQII